MMSKSGYSPTAHKTTQKLGVHQRLRQITTLLLLLPAMKPVEENRLLHQEQSKQLTKERDNPKGQTKHAELSL